MGLEALARKDEQPRTHFRLTRVHVAQSGLFLGLALICVGLGVGIAPWVGLVTAGTGFVAYFLKLFEIDPPERR